MISANVNDRAVSGIVTNSPGNKISQNESRKSSIAAFTNQPSIKPNIFSKWETKEFVRSRFLTDGSEVFLSIKSNSFGRQILFLYWQKIASSRQLCNTPVQFSEYVWWEKS